MTIAYRRRLIDSPSYTLNHEEVFKALEEDIRFAEGLSPVAVEIDANGAAKALKVEGQQGGEKVSATLPARTILVAAGTQPNTVLAREDATHAFIDGKYFRALDEEGEPVTLDPRCNRKWGEKATLYQWALAFGVVAILMALAMAVFIALRPRELEGDRGG